MTLPEIKPIPGLAVPPIVVDADKQRRRFVFQDDTSGAQMYGPAHPSNADAIEAWNTIVDRIVKAAREGK